MKERNSNYLKDENYSRGHLFSAPETKKARDVSYVQQALGWCLNLISVPAIGLGHYDPLSSHEIDGVRKENKISCLCFYLTA